jgi:hypothetical protein
LVWESEIFAGAGAAVGLLFIRDTLASFEKD